MTGGPPVRGEALPYWEPAGAWPGDDAAAGRWLANARRIAAGLAEIAHLTATVDAGAPGIAVPVGREVGEARGLRDAVLAERVGAVLVEGATEDGGWAYGVALPCGPDFTAEEVTHVVLAVMKAVHGVGEGSEEQGAGSKG